MEISTGRMADPDHPLLHKPTGGPGIKPPNHQEISISVGLKGLEPFKRIINVMGEFALDERIPELIRTEYVSKIIRVKD